jgi:diguanylate cyclase (GGDEF)-like protein
MDHDAARGSSGKPSGGAAFAVAREHASSMEPLLRAALDSAMPGLILLDLARRVRHVTPAAASLLGLPPDGHAGTQILRLLSRSYWLDEAALRTLAAAFSAADLAEPRKTLLSVPHASGPRTVALDVRRAGEAGFVATLTDVTEARENQDWLLDQAFSDPVTGLWNRQHFMLMLRDRLDGPHAAGTAVLLLDLKRFRAVVEAVGAEGGDLLLRLVGRRLSGFLREDDLLARFASDEFAIMISEMPDREALTRLSARIEELIGTPFLIEGQTVATGTYMGVARALEDGDRCEVLIANAGLALSAARAEGNGRMRFFEPRMTERARARRLIEADLRMALIRGEFEVHYQPQIGMRSRRIDGFEALVRWRCPTRGMVPPADFIPLIEEMGMIGVVGEWVLQQACAQAVLWPDEITIAVNASPMQVEAPGFAACVQRALAGSGLPGHRLEIEVTENLLLRDEPSVLTALADLRALGVRIVLDDFGTGYASLSQLARFRFDRIKIDRSFISAPETSADHAVIVRAIAALGLSLGVPTTAEGVETAQQLLQVSEDGCTSVQGYYFSRPIPAEDIAMLLKGQMPAEGPVVALDGAHAA